MKLARTIILAVFTAFILFLGVSLLWAFLAEREIIGTPFDFVETARLLSGSPWNWRIGLLCLAVGAVVIILKVREVRREQCIAFDNPDGEVAISMDAVEDFIRRVGMEFDGVKSLIPTIHAGADGIGVSIRMDLWSGTSIPRLSEEMQTAVKMRVQDSLGINVSYVSVSVGKISGEGGQADEFGIDEAEEEEE